ncbi:MAG: hypothetical protein G01um101472_484 [Parcubacteria group bacterium Gr01-1014_72]|nr:MAG: hypothetical protein G01um101472_484 [Parcubacteria group bacterium Gr01-1014_72]
MSDPKLWSKLFNEVYRDDVVPADALFVHGWGDLHEQLAPFVANFFKTSGARYLFLNGEESYSPGFPGARWFVEELVRGGVPHNAIVPVLPGKHTLHEAEGFIGAAVERDVKSAVVISVPAHILRAYLTNLGVALKKGLSIKLSARTLTGTYWEEEVEIEGLMGTVHRERTTRLGRLVSECARIVEYRRRYEEDPSGFAIASVEEGLAHLGHRAKSTDHEA